MPLTDMAARKAKPKDRPYKVGDSGGLYLLVNPSGSKLWNLKYRFGGKEKSLAIGPYPSYRSPKRGRGATQQSGFCA